MSTVSSCRRVLEPPTNRSRINNLSGWSPFLLSRELVLGRLDVTHEIARCGVRLDDEPTVVRRRNQAARAPHSFSNAMAGAVYTNIGEASVLPSNPDRSDATCAVYVPYSGAPASCTLRSRRMPGSSFPVVENSQKACLAGVTTAPLSK